MDKYTEYLEKLITETLLPVYFEHCRLTGRPGVSINKKLLEALRQRKKIPVLLQRQKYD